MNSPEESSTTTDDATRFAISEDWLATIVGLTIVILAAAGIITEGWLPL